MACDEIQKRVGTSLCASGDEEHAKEKKRQQQQKTRRARCLKKSGRWQEDWKTFFFHAQTLLSLALRSRLSPPAVSLSEPEPNLGIVPTIIKERKTKLQNYSSPAAAAAASLSLSASRAATAAEATDLLEPELGAPPPTAPFAARSRDPASAARSAGES